MATYRTGFGTGNYGVRVFGLDGAITDAIGSTTTAATTVSSAEIVRDASASVSASASTSSAGVFVVDASASTSASASTTSAGEQIFQTSATASASITSATASLQFITNAEASTSMSSSFTAAGLRVALGEIYLLTESSATSDSQLEANGGSQISAVATVSPTIVRVRFGDGSIIQGVSAFADPDGRRKWEYIPVTSVDWNKLAA